MKKTLACLILLAMLCQLLFTSCTLIPGSAQDTGDNVANDGNTGGNDSTNGDEKTPTNDDKKEPEKEPGKDEGGSVSSANVPGRFKKAYTIDRSKLEAAAAAATEKLLAIAEESGGKFPKTCSEDYQYVYGENNNWTSGMYTGSYLMAYQLTGDERFAEIVDDHIDSFVYRVDNRVGMDDHDVGFAFVPSCVGAYKILGSEKAKDAAIKAVADYYGTGYSQDGKFIIRAHKWSGIEGYRTMIDSQMNASLFFWAGDYLNNADYTSAAVNHTATSVELLVRVDGSTYHHYQFDPETSEPLYGITWQGLADESCWSRGQSWGVYGFSIAYSYTKDPALLEAQRNVTYYMLNHLPKDLIPYWDYTYTFGSEPRDTSAAAIAVCGMLDMAEMLPEGAEQRIIYESAAAQIMEALIDKYTGDIGVDYDGLINGVTHAKPQGHAIGECAPYADYFYLEALARFLNEDFIRPW